MSPTDAELQVSIPAREHGLLAGLLVDALLAEDQSKTGRDAAVEVARQRGAEIGAAESERARPGAPWSRTCADLGHRGAAPARL